MNPTTPDTTIEPCKGLELAVSYLRVSSKKQLDTARDIDPDGNSIATQRIYVDKKATNIGARVEREFFDPGVSAQTIDKRREFQELIEYLRDHREIKYVIVYARSRAFRNYIDAAITKRLLDKLGVRLVSAREDFGEGIFAEAMEAITDIFNDVQNKLSGEDIRIKLQNKATNGGTIGRTRLGYLNARVEIEGRLVNAVTLDPQRAPLVKKAWELYATDEYSIDRLVDTMADLGLTTRPSGRHPVEKPVSDSSWHHILRDPYYAGFVKYKGDLYPGRHEALVSQELFDRVQDILNARSAPGQRDRIHQHYLKGILFCSRCRQNGRTTRLIYTEVTGKTKQRYSYFICRARQEKLCDLPHLRVERVEHAVAERYRFLRLPEDFSADVHARLEAAVDDEQGNARERHASLKRRLDQLDAQESNLVDLAADGTLPQAKIRVKLNTIKTERSRIEASLTGINEQLAVGAAVLRDALTLTANPYLLYQNADPNARRHLNQTFYDKFFVDELEVVDDDKKPLFSELHEALAVYRDAWEYPAAAETLHHRQKQRSPHDVEAPRMSTATALPTLADVFRVRGLSKAVMVELRGLEPLTPTLPVWCATSCAIAPRVCSRSAPECADENYTGRGCGGKSGGRGTPGRREAGRPGLGGRWRTDAGAAAPGGWGALLRVGCCWRIKGGRYLSGLGGTGRRACLH